jgi:hypothetical protein
MLFNNEDPQVAKCTTGFKREFDVVIHRSKSSRKQDMELWLCNIT